MMRNTEQYLDWAHRVLRIGAPGLNEIADVLDGGFVRAAGALLHCKGHVVTTDMNKFRHVGRKIAVTVAPTGTPTFFIHPVETAHDDLGMIVNDDIAVATSNSGGSDEITVTMPALKRKDVTLIGITTRPAPTLARHADTHITIVVSKEAYPLGLTSTTSTAAVMALGDALVVVLLRTRALMPDDSALGRPAGSLGRCLLLWVADIAHGDDVLPAVVSGTPLREAIVHMGEKGLDTLTVIDETDRLKGVLTDDDLRCLFQQCDNFAGLTVDDIMHTSLETITADKLAIEALKHMQVSHINGLLVTEADDTLTDVLNMHDLLMTQTV